MKFSLMLREFSLEKRVFLFEVSLDIFEHFW